MLKNMIDDIFMSSRCFVIEMVGLQVKPGYFEMQGSIAGFGCLSGRVGATLV
jgi:hypothetical protein